MDTFDNIGSLLLLMDRILDQIKIFAKIVSECLLGHAVGEFEELLANQSSLVNKLRDECRHLASKLEQITAKYK